MVLAFGRPTEKMGRFLKAKFASLLGMRGEFDKWLKESFPLYLPLPTQKSHG